MKARRVEKMVDTQLEDDETPLLQEVNWNGLEEILDEGKYLEDVYECLLLSSSRFAITKQWH